MLAWLKKRSIFISCLIHYTIFFFICGDQLWTFNGLFELYLIDKEFLILSYLEVLFIYMTMGIKNYICLLLSFFYSCICDGILDHLKPALIYLWFPHYHSLSFILVLCFSVLVNYFYRTRAHGLLVCRVYYLLRLL